MKKKTLNFAILALSTLSISFFPIIVSSCSKESIDFYNTELNGEKYIDLDLYYRQLKEPKLEFKEYSKEMGRKYSQNWYDSLTKANWDFSNDSDIPVNLFCSSEQQALALYCNAWGDFWNIDLHNQKEPENKLNKMQGQIFPNETLEIRGGGAIDLFLMH